MSDQLQITEVFFSIQGESTYAGLPCVFIRLRGCHLRCVYCDSEYSFFEGDRRTIGQVLQECERLTGPGGCDLYEVTGGEPLLQPGVHGLMRALCDAGKTVLLETSGACDIALCDPRVIRILDLKTPGSGEAGRNLWSNIEHLRGDDEVKFVLTSREDYEWSVGVVAEHRLTERVKAVLLSPAHAMPPGRVLPGCAGLAIGELVEWMMLDIREGRLPSSVRVQTQLHKLIWDPMTRGV